MDLPYQEADVVLPAVENGGRRDGRADGDPVVGLNEAGAVQVVAPGRLVRVGLSLEIQKGFSEKIRCT
jgi:hypothetical protein